MNIFDLRRQLIDDYSSYIKSFIQIRTPRIREYVQNELFHNSMLWPDPLIQLNPVFEPGHTIDELVAEGILHPACARIFRRGKDEEHPQGEPLRLHTHQDEAIRVAREGQSYVLTTGTGSGKSLSYIIPIVDYVLRHPEQPGIKAIVVYPMNALANSQLGELNKYIQFNFPDSAREVTFRRYTGQERQSEREEIIAHPPDILLTNYVMLELVLTRLRERRLMQNAQLRFLVLDELHTYRGRQGADVALLVRRVRDRLTARGAELQCIGTSATLAGAGTYAQQRQEVSTMASRIFGCEVQPDHVIGETLVRVTDEVDEASPAFQRALTQRVAHYQQSQPQNYSEFQHDPLSIWIESTFGVQRQTDGRLGRKKPLRITGTGESESAAALLQRATGESEQQCIEAITQGLLSGNEKIRSPLTGRAPFAFRLHQFISKGDTVYSTLELDPARHITLQRQQFAPGGRERVLFPLVFCRACGQEYYSVRWQDEHSFIERDVQDQLRYTGDGIVSDKNSLVGIPGFLYFSQNDQEQWPADSDGILARVPGEWKEIRNGKERLISSSMRKNVPQPYYVNPAGQVLETDDDEGMLCHFVPAPFRFCLHCGVSYSTYIDNDFEKLTELSSEGRSTATTILSLSAIRHLREAQEHGDALQMAAKMLSFTDNRQDASLQAGHFNDFVEIGQLRSALYCAVKKAGAAGIQHDTLTQKVFDALQLSPDKYAVNPEAKYSAKIKTEQALRNILGYRLYLDLRRGWRITSPNLEQCGLLRIEYQDLREVCEDQELWQQYHEVLRTIPVQARYRLCRTLLDHMRRELAIRVDYLDDTRQSEFKQQSSQHLITPWGLDENEELLYATRLYPRSRGKEDDRSERYLSGLSSYGRYVRAILRGFDLSLKADETQKVIRDLLSALSTADLVEEVRPPRPKGKGKNGEPETEDTSVGGYQLAASSIIWYAGDGTEPYHDPLRTPNLPDLPEKRVNQFFLQFYQDNADDLQRMEDLHAAEHTAQVPAERREERENAFRANELPILYCSPTMELGVDIAELNVVNMRNVPPTPANYAQRSGRAGRSGQPALVFSYCSTGSSHDQYFFQHPGNMVSGAVSPPRLDLTNEDLLRAHVYAIWLAETNLSLGESLKDLLDVEGDEPSLELQPLILHALRDLPARQRAILHARRVLQTLANDLTEETAPWFTPDWVQVQLDTIEQSFDAAADRWRGLYRAAQAQRDTQNGIIRDASRSEEDKQKAKRLRSEAEAQLELLTASSSSERIEFSEFYSYRYFASEGFLPGYNFPRLPLSAYIPARRAKQRDEYLSRPRFLAISEFAPRAIVYHEGSRYIINRSILSVREDRSGVLTSSIKQCERCGYLHPLDTTRSVDVCARCKHDKLSTLTTLYRLQNVSTRRRDKINSDEEERQRQGYDIRTGVRFPNRRDGKPSFFVAYVEDEQGERIARLTYGQAASLWRINLGPARRKDKDVHGFVLDTERGYWGKDDESADDPGDAMSGSRLRVIPYVEDTRNCLLFEPLVSLNATQLISLQAALKNAIQVRFQLEDNELAAEPLPDAKKRSMILFYEASEGGAGVLRQLIDAPLAVAEVAAVALGLCHFDPQTGVDYGKADRALEECVAACYHCLMTYANQKDHRFLDRQSIKPYLQRLTGSTPAIEASELITVEAGLSALEQEWLTQAQARQFVSPDQHHCAVPNTSTCPDFLYTQDGRALAVYVDGDEPQRGERDGELIEKLENAGYMVVRFGAREQWDAVFAEYADLFRRDA
ncbi:DEAD/DEAH box helicase [Dictyobacter kobayashii]|uniref:RNA helicase n=1 Tax=Dictyobacter kobayashii TaxID=2014872 RepID=A0A402AWZ1_9CHLR|nr:DEAD/DEAH box helicase [Dictyobacter kobayashii]GCE23605.1 RNA helicase [Dictyobacter kobayashii]